MTAFTIYPAIDLRNGQVVRLKEGDPKRQTIYDRDPAAVARRWIAAGATWLHVVNLDGAFGEPQGPNQAALAAIAQVAQPLGIEIQFGGGLRSLAEIERAFGLGASRVILGTLAVEHPEWVVQALREWSAAGILIGIDARERQVKVRGWQTGSGLSDLELGQEMAAAGVKTLIYTNIARDGLGSGIDLEATQELASETGLAVIASGGAAGLADIRAVKAAGLAGVIVGQALYEGQVDLQAALRC